MKREKGLQVNIVVKRATDGSLRWRGGFPDKTTIRFQLLSNMDACEVLGVVVGSFFESQRARIIREGVGPRIALQRLHQFYQAFMQGVNQASDIVAKGLGVADHEATKLKDS